ncbi:MAG: cupredoxin domain-containing protein [Candidatus Yanofskybacteria bacterium]|nr:cupredoxin domain-containing protein [Candidatus Yanofskybacteria bacterium]
MENINRQSGITPIAIVLIVLVIVGFGGGFVYVKNKNKPEVVELPSPTATVTPIVSSSPLLEVEVDAGTPSVKEFSMTSYYEMKDGKASANFSLSQIKVNKGDTVRIKVTNTKGSHDFVIDEYSIKKPTPLGQEVTIEFKADKAGSFKYYCSMPGHRQMGQEGTLIVE